MPEKRPEVIEHEEGSPEPPDLAEGSQTTETKEEQREDATEDEMDVTEERHEKAHRRKRGKPRS